jgi:hypothetical protein
MVALICPGMPSRDGRPSRTLAAPVQLTAGRTYHLVVEHCQLRDDPSAQLVWTPPNLVSDAVQAARNADVVVAFVGISPQLDGEEMIDVFISFCIFCAAPSVLISISCAYPDLSAHRPIQSPQIIFIFLRGLESLSLGV